MKSLFFISIFVSVLFGDTMLYKTLACPTIDSLKKFQTKDTTDTLKLEMYTIANNCIILSKGDEIEALGYDPRNSKEIFQKILYKRTSKEFYLLRKSILVEQGGKKNRIRF